MRPDITAGELFPDYKLSDHTGTVRSISEIQRSLPMVLHLARGGYDPKEHRFLRHLVDHYPDFKLAYTRICVITKDNQLDINEFRDAVGAEWPFLSDPDHTVQRDLDIKEYTDPVHSHAQRIRRVRGDGLRSHDPVRAGDDPRRLGRPVRRLGAAKIRVRYPVGLPASATS